MNSRSVKIFLRIAISIGFLSAVADRFGVWPKDVSVWSNWSNFLQYTEVINPWFPKAAIPILGSIATVAEITFSICLLVGFRTELVAKLSGVLLLIFGLSMALSTGIKGALDYSVFSASAGAFALSLLKEKYWEIDTILSK